VFGLGALAGRRLALAPLRRVTQHPRVVATKPLAPPADVGSRQSSTQPTSSWQPYTWKGREYIGGGVNVYHNRARIYDPALGRFTTEDPMGYEAGDTNLYAFTGNNPRNWNDPSGHSYGVVAAQSAAIGAYTGGIVAGLNCIFNIVEDSLRKALENPTSIQKVSMSQCGVEIIKGAGWGAIAGGTGGLGVRAFRRGQEYVIRSTFPILRIAPFGNRTGHPTGRYPHYHRQVPHPTPGRARRGEAAPNQGSDRHRPWDSKPGEPFWDRF
jgi:RHS repeat-associated protein